MPISIRTALESDFPSAFSLIKELAEFENCLHEVNLNLEQFIKDGNGANPQFNLNVAVEKKTGEVVGMALFYPMYSTWKGKILYLDDLVVRAANRKQGIGQLLLDSLFKHARKINAKQIRWHVLDWNEPAIQLYKKLGAKLEDEWITCKISGDQI